MTIAAQPNDGVGARHDDENSMRSRYTIAASIASSLIASGVDIGGTRAGVETFNDFRLRFNPRNPAPMPRRRRFKQNKRKGL